MSGAAAPSPSGADRCAAPLSDRERVVAGYIRVSTASQDHAYQRRAIELAARAHGAPVAIWFGDVASGKTLQRPQLERMRRALRSGALSAVWVWRLDRLTRSGIADTLALVREIRDAGATVHSVADGYAVDGGPTGELVLAVLAWASQWEREKIAENQAAARARMESQGRSWGRPRLPSPTRDAARALRSQGKTPREIARELQISQTSVRRFLRDLEP